MLSDALIAALATVLAEHCPDRICTVITATRQDPPFVEWHTFHLRPADEAHRQDCATLYTAVDSILDESRRRQVLEETPPARREWKQ